MGLFSNVESIFIGDKKVKSIKVGEATLYEVQSDSPSQTSPSLIMTVNVESGDIVRSDVETDEPFTFIGDSLNIDWGDGSAVEPYTTGPISHMYNIGGEYTIIISGEITAINDYAFFGSVNITDIIFPSSLISIGERSFQSCHDLETIIIPSSVTSIDCAAFFEGDLTSITLEGTTPPTIENGTLDIPISCVVKVPLGTSNDYMYASNYPDSEEYSYQEYIIPQTPQSFKMTVAGTSYFSKYTTDEPFTFTGDSLSVDWGDGTTETYTGGQFEHQYNEEGLYTITVTGNITGINYEAFNERDQIAGLFIPSTITSIGGGSFNECTGLTNIVFGYSIPPVLASEFSLSHYCGAGTRVCTIYVPTGSLSAYQNAQYYPQTDYVTVNYVEY